MDNLKKKKRWAIFITIFISRIFAGYFLLYFARLLYVTHGRLKYALGIIPRAMGIGMIKVRIDRIKEINRGETDDISKY